MGLHVRVPPHIVTKSLFCLLTYHHCYMVFVKKKKIRLLG